MLYEVITAAVFSFYDLEIKFIAAKKKADKVSTSTYKAYQTEY